MRVGIDGRSLSVEAGRGVARVTHELLTATAARFPGDEWRVLMPGRGGSPPPGTSAWRSRVPRRLLFGFAAVARRPRLDRLLGAVDVVWLPAPAPVAISPDVPSVLTLHDLSWIQRPGDFTAYERAWHLLARPRAQAMRARHVIAPSEQTRLTALAQWGLDPARVTVVRPPIATPAIPGPASSFPGEPYFLWVGALEPRKAPEVLEAAWSRARARGLEARLVVVGEGRIPLQGAGVRRVGRVSDAELGALYRGALALVMPSRLEGAGLPPLEAALHATPTICSDLAVLRESLGPDGAEWVPPGDVDALAEAMLVLARDRGRRKQIAAAAQRVAMARVDPGPAADLLHALLGQAASVR